MNRLEREKWTVTIVIDGESAEELFAVGPNDLREYFLPKLLNVKSKDIKKIQFFSGVP